MRKGWRNERADVRLRRTRDLLSTSESRGGTGTGGAESRQAVEGQQPPEGQVTGPAKWHPPASLEAHRLVGPSRGSAGSKIRSGAAAWPTVRARRVLDC